MSVAVEVIFRKDVLVVFGGLKGGEDVSVVDCQLWWSFGMKKQYMNGWLLVG